jgi:hypothetical protein
MGRAKGALQGAFAWSTQKGSKVHGNAKTFWRQDSCNYKTQSPVEIQAELYDSPVAVTG